MLTSIILQTIVNFLHNFICNILLVHIKQDIITFLKKNNIPEPALIEIKQYLEKYISIFEEVSTKDKRFQIFRNRGLIDHKEFYLGTKLVDEDVGNGVQLVPMSMHGIYFPLSQTLKFFLQIPGMFVKIMKYIGEIDRQKNIISNIMQSDLYIKKYAKRLHDNIVLPLIIFHDDLETRSAMGAHAGVNKFGATYVSLACLPPNMASHLDCILCHSLVYSDDKKYTKNAKVFSKLIEEANFLRNTGIFINIENTIKNIKFDEILIVGDNLGANGISGFVESFQANYYCRICKVSSEEAKTLMKEKENLLRTRSNYESDLEKKDLSKTGIKEECAFHQIEDFHITENQSVDMMHDFLEGVCTYDLHAIITEFIFIKKYFTLEILNARIRSFNYGSNTNKPPEILLNRLKGNLTLKMSAAEMLCFVRYFGLIIGDLIPELDEHWKLFKYLRQILDILLSPRIVKSHIKCLENLIEKHHQLYVQLFGFLKPKYHFLIHYPRILKQNGPCVLFWSMRFESFHRKIKAIVQATASSKNLLKTIAIKQGLMMCELFNTTAIEDDIKLSSRDDSNCEAKTYFDTFTNNAEYYNQIEIWNILYKVGSFIIVNIEESEKQFGEIIKIIKVNNDIYFHINIFQEITFDEHYHAYVVENSKKTEYLKLSELPLVCPCLLIK